MWMFAVIGHTDARRCSSEGLAWASRSAVSPSRAFVCAAKEASSASSSYGRLISADKRVPSVSLLIACWLHQQT